MLEATELELSYGGRYLRLYGPLGCMEMDEAYGISNAIPNAITIGDNGGGEAIVIVNNAVYRVSYGALDSDELEYGAESMEELLFSRYLNLVRSGLAWLNPERGSTKINLSC